MSAHDFDFLHGSWSISHRALTSRLTGCQEWDTYSSTMRCWPILGGAGNMDEGEFPSRGYFGMTVRLYDAAADNWSLYWMTSRSAAVEPPVTGRFGPGGIGEFLGPDTHQGIPVLCRFRWLVDSPDKCRWEQALSADDGLTWETNWYMELTRTG
jgi:hypothetical protein